MRMKLLVLSIALFSTILLVACAPAKNIKSEMTVAFYNVENLFDTIDTPNKIDEEFVPADPKNWNTERYFKKMNDLAKVISSIDPDKLPDIVGVCEIENNTVLSDLAKSKMLKKANYQIVWNDGPDERGIDCALLYNPKTMKLISQQFLKVVNPLDTAFATREIVYVQGAIKNEVFHIFVNHWPSRRGGQDGSNNDRVLAATVLRNKVDQIFAENENSNIIIMGDMNDEPINASISEVLKALPSDQPVKNNQLVNLMYAEAVSGLGSYAYKGEWDMIDNLIVSGYLINKKSGLKTTADNGYIFHQPFMEFVNDKGEMSPNRTYGRTYFGGVSDHFPVYLNLK